MAKAASTAPAMPMEAKHPDVRVEMPMKELKGFALGDKVTITITGLVKTLEGGRDPGVEPPKDGPYECVSNIEVEVITETVTKAGTNDFEALATEEAAGG